MCWGYYFCCWCYNSVLYIQLCVEGARFKLLVLLVLQTQLLMLKIENGAWDLILVWTSAQKLVYTKSMLYPWIWREETLRIIRLFPKTNILTDQNTYHQMLKIRIGSSWEEFLFKFWSLKFEQFMKDPKNNLININIVNLIWFTIIVSYPWKECV